MRYAFIERSRERFPTAFLCRVLKVSRSGYYDWRQRGLSPRRLDRAAKAAEVKAVFESNRGILGYRKVHKELVRLDASAPCEETVRRLMSEQGLKAVVKRKFVVTTDSGHNKPVAPNVLNRDFAAEKPDLKWVSDITYLRSRIGWIYLVLIIDLYSRYVVGWRLSRRVDGALACEALKMALRRRSPEPGLIHHSDRGVQYACADYQEILGENGIICSMSRKGNCWDNAPAESFIGKLKSEFIRNRVFADFEEAERELFWYIELFHNRRRPHAALDYLSPAEYERQTAFPAA